MAPIVTELSSNALKAYDATPPPAPRAGRPRFNGTEAFLHEFYEAIILLEILQRRLGLIKEPTVPVPSGITQSRSWKVFLNQLCWLTDRENGGNTTGAIAVQATHKGPKYWLAANYDPHERGVSHLGKILVKLTTANLVSTSACRAAHGEILKLSLSFSKKKYDEYCNSLSKAIHYASKIEIEEDSVETQFLIDLKPVLELQEPSELCTCVFKYVKSERYKEIRRKHRDKAPNQSGSAWHNICHCLGRLQVWVRAIKVIICFVKDHPEAVQNHETGFVRCPERLESLESLERPAADHKTHLPGVLERILPNDKERASKALKTLQEHRTPITQEIDTAFKDLYGDKAFRPRCHAELMILEHFWNQKLPFFSDIAYVGCSKPSCYCCDLYFRSHPSGVTTRASNGNVWRNWCLPPGLKQKDGKKLEWDYKIMLKRMTGEIRSDALTLIESELPRRRRKQDSTTGIWTAPTLAMLPT